MKVNFKIIVAFILLFGISAVIVACSNESDGGNDSFSYTDIGPNLGGQWKLFDARRSDTGLWALYNSNHTDAQKLARYDFQSKQWQFWDFELGIQDFDVWLEDEDNGNGAVVIETVGTYQVQVRSLSSAIKWDVEDIDQFIGNIALGWGAGSAAFTNWIGGYSNGHAVYQEIGSCCPVEWNKIDILPSVIYNMWASSRQDGYVLVSTANRSFIVYSDGGAEITFAGSSYAIENVAWDTQTRIPYVVIDGILYRIEANPNANNAQAVAVADLTALNYGVTFGSAALDIRNGKAFVSYGAVVDLSNGSISTSWIGQTSPTNVDDMIIVMSISNSSYVFTPPNDQDGVLAYVNIADPNTFEYYETWIRVNNAL